MQRLNYSELIGLFKKLNVDELAISDYNKIYFKKHIQSIEYSVELARQILDPGIKNSNKRIEYMAVVEIGGGTGIISIMAKWMGFNKVIYSDTYEQSCTDFKVISQALGLIPDDIICGNSEEVAEKYSNRIDLIVSRDVLEHMYDPALFFRQCIENFNGAVMVHNTSANSHNFIKRSIIKKIQVRDELYGNTDQFKPGDSAEPFLEMRYKFIHSNFSVLDEKIIAKLAELTRGKNYRDIYTAVELFIRTGKYPVLNEHPTNTCDPATGNRTENLLTIEEYNALVIRYGYRTKWVFAPYNEWSNKGIKKSIIRVLNYLIKRRGTIAKYISPALIMISVPPKK